MPQLSKAVATATVKEYLLSLQESGVEGIPLKEQPGFVKLEAALPEQLTAVKSESLEKAETLEEIKAELGDCRRCKLAEGRKNIVFGVGNQNARLVFVGEGPGADEDRQGEPFVGEAGKILNRIIKAMGIKREDVYICNVVKCRPPENRNPASDEISFCSPFLIRQLQAIKPEVIVALGKVAADRLLGKKEAIGKMRGKFQDYQGIPLMPTYHPAFLKRKEAEGDKQAFWDVWSDMTQVLQTLKLPVPDKSRKS